MVQPDGWSDLTDPRAEGRVGRNPIVSDLDGTVTYRPGSP